MTERRRRNKWNTGQLAMFARARQYLSDREPEIVDFVDKFNNENPHGFFGTYTTGSSYRIGPFKWGYAGLIRPETNGAEPVRLYPNSPQITDYPGVVPVHIITPAQADYAGNFAAELGTLFDLRAERILAIRFSHPELIALFYGFKPNFRRFE